MTTLELSEKYFETRDIYQLLEIEKNASAKDIKKAYYKLSLQVHPDRVGDAEKETATEKFKVLSKIYQVLTDKDKRALYDEQGTIDDEEDGESKLTSWLDLWRTIFKPITTEDISNYQKNYVDSELERSDMKKAYLSGKGCINQMMNDVPFLKVEDEPRLQRIVGEMIAAGDVPDFKIFTKEPAAKRSRRHKKYARESKEAEEIKAQMAARESRSSGGNLEQQIMQRQQSRESNYNSLMDRLLAKYGDEDDSEPVDFDALDRSSRKKKKSKTTAAVAEPRAAKTRVHAVKTGKVKKGGRK